MEGEDVEVCVELMKSYGPGMMDGSCEDLEPLGLEWQGVEGTEEDPWLLVSDGGLRGTRGGIGIVLARRNRILELRGYGIRVHKGDSTELERLGKAVLLRTTRGIT